MLCPICQADTGKAPGQDKTDGHWYLLCQHCDTRSAWDENPNDDSAEPPAELPTGDGGSNPPLKTRPLHTICRSCGAELVLDLNTIDTPTNTIDNTPLSRMAT